MPPLRGIRVGQEIPAGSNRSWKLQHPKPDFKTVNTQPYVIVETITYATIFDSLNYKTRNRIQYTKLYNSKPYLRLCQEDRDSYSGLLAGIALGLRDVVRKKTKHSPNLGLVDITHYHNFSQILRYPHRFALGFREFLCRPRHLEGSTCAGSVHFQVSHVSHDSMQPGCTAPLPGVHIYTYVCVYIYIYIYI